jgi:hypothetical protein
VPKLGLRRARAIIGVDPILAYVQVQATDTNDWEVAGGLRGAPSNLRAARRAISKCPPLLKW